MNAFSPSGASINTTATVTTVVSNQFSGVILFGNLGTTGGLAAVVSAGATAGDVQAVASPVPGGGMLFVQYVDPVNRVYVTGASSVWAQSGYLGK